jgi:sugar phosphate isomerase/epimerase
VVIVIEPLNRGECNFINTVTEAVDIARRVQSPNVKCLVDSYHFWLEDESLSALEAAMPWIRHVHVADKEGRVPPGESGKSDYGPFFRVLKQGGYDGPIAVECRDFSVPEHGRRVFDYLTSQWHAA